MSQDYLCRWHHLSEKIEVLQLSIDGKPIEYVKYLEFLGILFDENLTWKCHINMVNQYIVESNWNTQYIKTCLLTKGIVINISFSYLQPTLIYGLLLWGTHVNRVSKLQKKTVRIMSNSDYLAHSEPLFKKH